MHLEVSIGGTIRYHTIGSCYWDLHSGELDGSGGGLGCSTSIPNTRLVNL